VHKRFQTTSTMKQALVLIAASYLKRVVRRNADLR